MIDKPVQPPGDAAPVAPLTVSPPSFRFSIWFMVWILAALITSFITFLLPTRFTSSAHIRVEYDAPDAQGLLSAAQPRSYDAYYLQTEFEIIQSEVVLGRVVDALGLTVNGERWKWPEKYAGGQPLTRTEAINLLKRQIDLRPIRNTSLLELQISSDNPEDAANLANALAEAYREYRLAERRKTQEAVLQALHRADDENLGRLHAKEEEIQKLSLEQGSGSTLKLQQAKRDLDGLQRFREVLQMKIFGEAANSLLPGSHMVEVVDRAYPAMRPVYPNIPLNLWMGVIIGGLSGLCLATALYFFELFAFRRRAGLGRTPIPPRFRAVVHAGIALIIGAVIGYHCGLPVSYSTLIVLPLVLVLGGLASAWIELANFRHENPRQTISRPQSLPIELST